MLLTGHKSRAIFDRYNIINEQELLEAGDQLVAYLAQHAQAMPRGGRPHPARTASPRTAPPRATHHRVRARGCGPHDAAVCRMQLAMPRTTAQASWSAGIGGSGDWRGPPATGEARLSAVYRAAIGDVPLKRFS